jgi:hypothetical protein
MRSCSAPQYEDNITPVSSPAILATSEQLRRSFQGSRYLSSLNVFEVLDNSIDHLIFTSPNWNSYGSPAPTVESVNGSKPILRALRAKLLAPERVLPSADGGVAFTFISETISRAAIESLNSGESYVLLYDLKGNSETIEWPPSSTHAQLELIGRVATHLRSDGLAAKSK